MQSAQPLLGRTLILVAHPDDEAVGCGGLMQRMDDPIVVFATDGAPRSEFFWSRYGSREEYARVRAGEAKRALHTMGGQHFHVLCEDDCIVDQELYLQLHRAYVHLASLVDAEMPDAILTMAYEGGHPDHDSCSFLAAILGREFQLPVWEMPLYHRGRSKFETQQFVNGEAGCELQLTHEELSRKQKMWAEYQSQNDVLREFAPDVERFRPLAGYDFSRPPHAGVLNYEAWQWPMKGTDLCRAFTSLLETMPNTNRKWGTVA